MTSIVNKLVNDVSTSVFESKKTTIPNRIQLEPNYPNPFNANTVISFEIKSKGYVDLSIYNVHAQKVTQLISRVMNPGYHSINWNGLDSQGNVLPSGIYFYTLQFGDSQLTKKLSFVR